MSDRPLRIGLLMHSLNPRGGVVHTLELADALVSKGHEVTVFAAARHGERLFRETLAELSVAALRADLPVDLVGMVGARIDAVYRHLRDWPDLVDLDVLHAQDSISANALARLCDEGAIPGFVRTVHHLDAFDEPQLQAWQTKGVLAASRLFCVSELWQGVLARDWQLRAERVSNGVNLQRFGKQVSVEQAVRDAATCRQWGVQSEGPVWLAVGGVESRKNTTRLLQAFVQARVQRPDAQLVIAGGASLLAHEAEVQAFTALAEQHGLLPGLIHSDRLVITGPLPDDVLPALYRRADAVAMPSLKEGFGLVVLEALACGTPAIASRIAPFTEHLGPQDVLWVAPTDHHDIARALLLSLDEQHVHPVLARANDICARMSWAHSARQHEFFYRQQRIHHA